MQDWISSQKDNKMRQGIIYCATNNINGKVYIGKTVKTLNQRRSDHYTPSEFKRSKGKSHFKNALLKYKKEDFKWEVLATANVEDLNWLEKIYIGLFDTKNNGYNSTDGGEGVCGLVVSEETKKLQSEKAKQPKPWKEKKIDMFSYETGEFVKSFDSTNKAGEELGISKTTITNNLKELSKKVKNKKNKVFFKYKK